jgi:hypothetical protein
MLAIHPDSWEFEVERSRRLKWLKGKKWFQVLVLFGSLWLISRDAIFGSISVSQGDDGRQRQQSPASGY